MIQKSVTFHTSFNTLYLFVMLGLKETHHISPSSPRMGEMWITRGKRGTSATPGINEPISHRGNYNCSLKRVTLHATEYKDISSLHCAFTRMVLCKVTKTLKVLCCWSGRFRGMPCLCFMVGAVVATDQFWQYYPRVALLRRLPGVIGILPLRGKSRTQIERLRSIDLEKVSISSSRHLVCGTGYPFDEIQPRTTGQAIFYVGVNPK
jgi:hypothetical protein